TEEEISIDGSLSEATWALPPTFTLDYETRPGDNVPPPVTTEVWITHDQRRLYVAVRAHDPEPEAIRARLRDRDDAFQDDFVGVVLDTFNDQRRAFEFFVNPLGVQMDLTQNDVSGGEDASWDALWDSAGRLTAEGYEVEMAIPFSSLRFPATSGEQTWGIDAVRIWPRDQSRRIGLNPLPRGSNCYLCHGSKLSGFAGISPGKNFELAPTVTATDVSSRPDPTQPFRSDSEVEAGLTARWGITPGTTFNATLNPDFSQVEADAGQLDVNTQFALFFPEKRPFFLEGADFFDTRINAVYTRTLADPDWGLKVTGKSGRNAYGAIVAEDSRTNLLIPGSQSSRLAFLDDDNVSSILRYRRDLAGSSSLGGLFTSREGDGYFNRVVGVDGLFRWGEGATTAVRLEALGSQTEYPLGLGLGLPGGTLEGTALRAAYQRQSRGGMVYGLYNDVSPDFRADLGFVPRADFRSGFGMVEKYWYSDDGERWWSRLTAGLETTWTYDHDGEPLQRQVAPYVWFNGPRQSFAHLYLGLGPSWFQGRELDRNFVVLYGEMQATPSIYVGLDSRVGEEIDFANARQGDIVRLIPRARFDVGRHLRLTLIHSYETLDVDGGRLYTANLSELRASYQLNVRTFLRLITQYSDLSRDPALYTFPVRAQATDLFNQLLFSYKLNPQTVLFVGYSDAYLGAETGFDDLDRSNRTLFLKVGYALVF
ncbi:MAG TPA: DUF5916 domain-containing protein, partial [Thermoanaerobaculia bacterium]|nr:DUF5916 domain-containing protein [Thermoanaerobaculia bacterium]